MSITVMKQALEALEDARNGTRIEYNDQSAYQDEITALRQAIEQAEKQFNPDWDQQAVLVERIRELEAQLYELIEALEDGLSACQSVSLGRNRKIIDADGDVSYWQKKEWCKWLDSEVAPKLKAALDKARGNT